MPKVEKARKVSKARRSLEFGERRQVADGPAVPRPLDPLQAIIEELGIGDEGGLHVDVERDIVAPCAVPQSYDVPDHPFLDLSQMRVGEQEAGLDDDAGLEDGAIMENFTEPPKGLDLAPKAVYPLEYALTSGPVASKSVQLGVDIRGYVPYVLLVTSTGTARRYLRISPEEFVILLKDDVYHVISNRIKENRPGYLFDIGGLNVSIDRYNNLRLVRGLEKFGFVIAQQTVTRLDEKRGLLRAALVAVKSMAVEAKTIAYELELYLSHNKNDVTLAGFMHLTPATVTKILLFEDMKSNHIHFIINGY